MGSLLMHAFTSIIHTFPLLWVFSILFFFFWFCFVFFLSLCFFYIFCLLFFSSFFFPPFHCACLWPFILPAVTGFAIFTSQPFSAFCGCPSKTGNWSVGCLTTTTTLCWLCHASSPNKGGFVLFLTPLDTHTRIRVKPIPYQHL